MLLFISIDLQEASACPEIQCISWSSSVNEIHDVNNDIRGI